MRDFINSIAGTGGGVTLGGAAAGQLIIAGIGLIIMTAFGAWGAYLRWKDSKALHDALSKGDISEAVRIRSK